MLSIKSGALLNAMKSASINQLQLLRCFSFNDQRQSSMLKKLMIGKRKSKEYFYDSNQSQTLRAKTLVSNTKNVSAKVTTRRATVLSKMFMRHITDLIATSELAKELSGFGLEITGVRICQKYHGLNIFWTATSTEDFDGVQLKLNSMSKSLRHDLSQMQLMGNIPHITFIRDQKLSYYGELDVLISKADYGEDYTPGYRRTRINDDFKSQSIEDINNSPLPPMRHDVFGLNHSLIMGHVKQNLAKSRKAWKAYESNELHPLSETKPFTLTTSFDCIREEAVSEKRSEQILNDYLKQRKLLRKLQRREEQNVDQLDEEDASSFDHHEEVVAFEDFDDSDVQRFYDELDNNNEWN